MSEYQNKAILLMQVELGDEALLDKEQRRDDFIQRAIELYYAMGGTSDAVQTMIDRVFSKTRPRVDAAVGEAMFELAGVGHVSDLDIIQAAYNKLDDANLRLSRTKRLPMASRVS